MHKEETTETSGKVALSLRKNTNLLMPRARPVRYSRVELLGSWEQKEDARGTLGWEL